MKENETTGTGATPGSTVVVGKDQREVNNKIDFQLSSMKIESPGAFVVRMNAQPNDSSAFNRLAANIRAGLDSRGFADTMVIVLVGDQVQIDSIDENAMFRSGWLHKDKVAKLLDQFGVNGGDKSTLEVITAIRNVVESPIENKSGLVNPDAQTNEKKTTDENKPDDSGYGM